MVEHAGAGFTGCENGQIPRCDGTADVTCVDPPTYVFGTPTLGDVGNHYKLRRALSLAVTSQVSRCCDSSFDRLPLRIILVASAEC